MQLKIKYWLLSFFILFTAINVAVGKPVASHAVKAGHNAAATALLQPAADKPLIDEGDYRIADAFISNASVWQTGINIAGKRVQTGKDLLLLHAAEYSHVVKTAAGKQVQSADSLTHIFLFLFPYHFFW